MYAINDTNPPCCLRIVVSLNMPVHLFVFVSVYVNTENGLFCITVIISCLPAVLWLFAFCFPFSVPH